MKPILISKFYFVFILSVYFESVGIFNVMSVTLLSAVINILLTCHICFLDFYHYNGYALSGWVDVTIFYLLILLGTFDIPDDGG